MAFETKTWTDRISEYPTRRTLTKTDGTTEMVTVERTEGEISQEGDAFSADNMNDLEQRISDADSALTETISGIRGTLSSGSTSISFTSSRITSDSMFNVFTSIFGVSPSAMSVSDTTLTLTFDAQTSDMEVGIQILA